MLMDHASYLSAPSVTSKLIRTILCGNIHEGVRHGCDVCGHLALSRDNLKRHIKLNHEKQAALFECNLCDYKAKKPHRIKDHKQAKHEGLTFNCDKCDFKNSSKNILKDTRGLSTK